jgi:nicotinate-nucleotide pyrophosphorylase (carboxylating)
VDAPIPLALIREALLEDLDKRGDVTTANLLPPGRLVRAAVIAKEPGVVCGSPIAAAVFKRVCPKAKLRTVSPDGTFVQKGQKVLEVSGPPSILSGERVALNFMQRLSGIATLTRKFVHQVLGTRSRIYDTRKTTPGFRQLEKYAVRCGGGENHRMGLYDAVLIKDNHLKAGRFTIPDLKDKIQAMRRKLPGIPIEMEAQNLDEVRQALGCGVDIVLLDNFELTDLRQAVWLVSAHRGASGSTKPLIEVSGGVNLDTVRPIAALGADRISVGQLTHSPRALDLSLEVYS